MGLSRVQRVIAMERKIVEAMAAGKSNNRITRELRVGKRRLRRIRAMAEVVGYLDGRVALPPFPEMLFSPESYQSLIPSSEPDTELLKQIDFIKDRLAAGWRPVSVFEELPTKVGRSSFYRFLTRHNLEGLGESARYAIPEIIHNPGEAMLVDWGKLYSAVNPETGRKQTLWAFVGVLGYSRYMMVRLMWRCDTTETLEALGAMFDEMGGVPCRVTSDNPKVFSLQACRFEPLLNPAYERFASHYDFTIECLPPRDPEKKGKVERPMPYVRRLFESFQGDRGNILEAQAFIERKVVIANERKHGTTFERPIDRFLNEELSTLKKLPLATYEREEFHEGILRKDSHIRFRGKYYSVDSEYIGKTLQIIATSKLVHIYYQGKLLDTHDRIHDRLRSKSTKPQHLAPWSKTMEEVSVYRSRAQNIGPHTDHLVTTIIAAGRGFIDFRKVWGILSLTKRFSHTQVEEACRLALECNTPCYRAVRAFAEAQTKPPCEVKNESPRPQDIRSRTNKFVRSVREYEEIIANQLSKQERRDDKCRNNSETIH